MMRIFFWRAGCGAVLAAAFAFAPVILSAPAAAQSVTVTPPTDPTLTRLYERIDSLEAALRDSTSRAERFQRERDQARIEADRYRKMVDDLNTQLAATPPPPPVEPPAPTGLADPGVLYDRGLGQVTTGDWAGAEASFGRFVDLAGGDPRMADGMYFKGFSQYQRGAMKEAGQTFVALVRAFPDSRRAGDAWAYLGAVLAGQGARTEACQAFASARSAPRLATDARILVTRESAKANCPR